MPVKASQKKMAVSSFDAEELKRRGAKTGHSHRERKEGHTKIAERRRGGGRAHKAESNLLEKLPWLKLSLLYPSLDLCCIN